MKRRRLDDDEIPYFSWDRRWTVAEIRRRLASESGASWGRIVAWILREAAFADVWQFLQPREVWERLDELEPFLGRKRGFWKYILGTWHELGRI
jgi:hypothetical protein